MQELLHTLIEAVDSCCSLCFPSMSISNGLYYPKGSDLLRGILVYELLGKIMRDALHAIPQTFVTVRLARLYKALYFVLLAFGACMMHG